MGGLLGAELPAHYQSPLVTCKGGSMESLAIGMSQFQKACGLRFTSNQLVGDARKKSRLPKLVLDSPRVGEHGSQTPSIPTCDPHRSYAL